MRWLQYLMFVTAFPRTYNSSACNIIARKKFREREGNYARDNAVSGDLAFWLVVLKTSWNAIDWNVYLD